MKHSFMAAYNQPDRIVDETGVRNNCDDYVNRNGIRTIISFLYNKDDNLWTTFYNPPVLFSYTLFLLLLSCWPHCIQIKLA